MATNQRVTTSIVEVSPLAEGGDGMGQRLADTQRAIAHTSPLIAELRELHKQRQDIVRAQTRLTNQVEAIHRRITGMKADERKKALAQLTKQQRACHLGRDGQKDAARSDAIEIGEGHGILDSQYGYALPDLPSLIAHAELAAMPILNMHAAGTPERRAIEKSLEKLAKQLPVYPWVASVRGFGAGSLAAIVGECGDLDNYANPAKVWKRMGLAVIDGERQRKVTGADALDHGYAPQRRAIMWNIGECLVKQNDGEYRAYYESEKARIAELHPDFTPALVNNRAKRHMTKRLLRDLWRQWREPVTG